MSKALDPIRLSKFLSLVLRHKPDEIGITLDPQGWVTIPTLMEALKSRHNTQWTLTILEEIVRTDQKGRYSIDGNRIRANQGHSIEIDLKLEPVDPPAVLYHGTPSKNLRSIGQQGILKGSRHHVHLSDNLDTATQVGNRRGEAVVLTVDTARMAADGHQFFRSTNGVWLTDYIDPRYISNWGKSQDT
jgi:putative RNA 2'-phosphotransferase